MTDKQKDKLAAAVVLFLIFAPLLLLAGFAGGIEQGLIFGGM